MNTRKPILALAGGLLASAVLSGCVGGTTYGTGVAQEEATVEDLANILAIRKKPKKTIDYDPRPDLVIPEDKQLIEPAQNTGVDDQSWPESPEKRVARVRDEADAVRGDVVEELRFARRQKSFQSVDPNAAPRGEGIPNQTCDPSGISMRKCTPAEISNAVRAQRKEIASVGKTGHQRRYLTEPPIEYRTYSQDAPIGDQGYTEEELARIEAERKRKQFQAATKPSL
ncbi:MAG: hypothetical protein KDJ69_09580 [Nitratireductor sp.]|nr:hypothetical protein [Nitratireductor sp.]